jgi:hypothetical protein
MGGVDVNQPLVQMIYAQKWKEHEMRLVRDRIVHNVAVGRETLCGQGTGERGNSHLHVHLATHARRKTRRKHPRTGRDET